MGTNFNPGGLRTFADMGFKPQFNTVSGQNIIPQQPVMTQPLQNVSQNTAPAVQYSQNTNLEKTPKKDIVTIAGKEYKKKNIIIAGLGIATTAVIAGVLAFNGRKAKMPAEIKAVYEAAESLSAKAKSFLEEAIVFREKGKEAMGTTDKLTEEAKDLTDKVQLRIKDAMETYNQNKNGARSSVGRGIIREIFDSEGDKTTVMRESYLDTSKPVRICTLNRSGVLEKIEEFDDAGKSSVINISSQGIVLSYAEGVEKLTESVKTDIELLFTDGKPSRLTKSLEQFEDGSSRAKVVLDFLNGSPKTYQEDYRVSPDGVTRIKKVLDFAKDKTLEHYKEDVETSGTAHRIKKKFDYIKNKYQEDYTGDYGQQLETRKKTALLRGEQIEQYEENVVCRNNTTETVGQRIRFVEGHPYEYSRDMHTTEAGVETTERILKYKEGQPIRYMENAASAPDNPQTAQKIYELINNIWTQTTSGQPLNAA